ncbi:beta strand repeat-containing protein, partial [Serratia fonticola]|uniref:beta strand repeat-containing protein n=1 Tax=Serratia fonticola TaxID=47917 RepID=UPI003AAAD9B7
MRNTTAIFELTRRWLNGVLLMLFIGAVTLPAVAVLSDKTGQIQGQAPTVTGSLQVLYPDGETVLADNATLGVNQIPSQFSVSSSFEGLILQDTDGDAGLTALVDTEHATQRWKHDGAELTSAQLAAPFGDYFLGQTLTLEVSAPVTASSVSGLPTTAEPQIITSTYSVAVPLPSIAADYFIVASGALANDTDSNALSAIVKDANGNLLSGVDVTFTVTDGAATPATQSVKTDENGMAQASLVSTVAGDNLVTASVGNTTTASKTSSFVAGMTEVIANGSGNAFALNAGFPTTGYAGANFTIKTNGNAGDFSWSADQAWVFADADGKVTFMGIPTSGTRKATITATPNSGGKAQTYSFTVSKWYVNGGTANRTAAFAYCDNEGLSVPTFSEVSSSARAKVGRLWDEWAMSGWSNTFAWTNDDLGGGYLGAIRISRGEKVGVAGTTSVYGVICSMDPSSVVDGSTSTIADLTVIADNAIADGLATNTVQALVANGAPVAGQTVSFTADNGGIIITETGTTGTDGIATAKLTNTRAGITNVTARVNGKSQSVETTFIADESTANLNGADFIVASGAVADGQASNALSAIVKDANGNLLSGVDVTFTVTDGAATPATQSVKTDENGMAQASLVSTVAGDNNVTGTSLGSTPAAKVSTFVPGAVSAANSELTVSRDSIVADGTATSQLTFTAKDVNNNPLKGRTVTFTTSGAGATGVKVGTVTGSNGVYTATLTAGTTAGPVNVAVAVDGTTVSGANNSKVVTLTQAPADGAKSALAVSPASIVANGTATSTLTFTAKDTNNNLLTGRTVTFATSGTGATGVKVGTVTGSNGVYTATLTAGTTAGPVNVAV